MIKMIANKRGYNYKWQQARKLFLKANPLCVMCKNAGITQEAYVVDHIIPHRGDKVLFWDVDNWQALCHNCHASSKQTIERRGYALDIGEDGWPKDDNHPVNKR